MKIEELMKGNLVLADGKKKIVNGFFKDHPNSTINLIQTHDLMDYREDKVLPILLLKSHLEDFGFPYKEQVGLCNVDRFIFRYYPSFQYWYVVDEISWSYFTKIEFVHEFQNFMRVVNGKELDANRFL